jgi:hypothetical protein
LDDLWVFCSTYDILELLIWHDLIVLVGVHSNKHSEEGEEVGEAVWNKETVRFVTIAIYIICV